MKYKDVIKYKRGLTHAVRNRQTEYLSKKKRNVIMGETFCGRKRVLEGLNVESGKVSCKTCMKAVKK